MRVRDDIERLYGAYNARDLEARRAVIRHDVDWSDGDCRLHGRSSVQDYWREQWARVRNLEEITDVRVVSPDPISVRIRQTVRDLNGALGSNGVFEHRYELRDGLIARMDSRNFTNETEHDRMTHDGLISEIYDGFNRRDIPAVLVHLAEDVVWANGMDGGHVHGRDALRQYWTAQWAAIRPRVEPRHVANRGVGVVAVEVHQVVHDLEGSLLLDEMVTHVFAIGEGLVTRFEIENAGGLSSLVHD